MKRFFSIITMSFILAAGLFAEPVLTEKQIEDFLNEGTYIKIITYNTLVGKTSIIYNYKQGISQICIAYNEAIYIINDSGERASTLAQDGLQEIFVDEHKNIIASYQY